MSARPFVPRLADEELDLLLSRSLDGDLSPEEEHGLETILAHDPRAARRKEELQRLVAEAHALPAPAPPFALATRVNSNVSEKAGRGGSVFHRFGFYPPPGMAVGAMALLGIVVAAITVLKPAPLRVAERVEGPVDVFLTEGENAAKRPRPETPKVASKEAARNQVAAAPAAPAPAEPAPAAVVASALEEKFKEKQVDAEKDAGKVDSRKKLAVQAPASVVAANEPASPASEEKQDKQRQKLSKTEADAATAPARRQAAPAPGVDAAAGRAAGGIGATAAKASGALANAEPARAWSVAVRGEGARRWMLRRAPEGRPSVASTQASAFRITLDAEGRVTSVRALDARPVQPALLEFVRGLVFAPVVAVTDGILRDEKAKDERADAVAGRPAEHPSEIDVEISTR